MAQETEHFTGPIPAQGEFCWTEIACTDLAACKSFYENVFDWKVSDAKSGEGFPYLEFSSRGVAEPDGGMYGLDPKFFGGHAPPPQIAIYVAVDDVDSAAEQAVKLGGSIMRPPTDIQGVGRMCVISDPAGAPVSLVTLIHHS